MGPWANSREKKERLTKNASFQKENHFSKNKKRKNVHGQGLFLKKHKFSTKKAHFQKK